MKRTLIAGIAATVLAASGLVTAYATQEKTATAAVAPQPQSQPQGALDPALAAQAKEAATALRSLPPEERRDKAASLLVAQMDKQLNLSDDQQAKLEPIYRDVFAQLAEMRNGAQGRRLRGFRDMRAKAETLRDECDKRVAAVLDEEQMKKYVQVRDQVRQAMREQVMSNPEMIREWMQPASAPGRQSETPAPESAP